MCIFKLIQEGHFSNSPLFTESHESREVRTVSSFVLPQPSLLHLLEALLSWPSGYLWTGICTAFAVCFVVLSFYCVRTCVCVCVCVCVCSVTQSHPTLCDPMDRSPPGSSVHRILQATVLERVAVSSSRGSSRPRDGNDFSRVCRIAGGFLTAEPPWKPTRFLGGH